MTEAIESKPNSRKWLYWLLGAAGFVMMLLFDHFGIYQYYWAIIVSIIAISFAVWENRAYHKEVWFWVSLFTFVLLHIFLVQVVAEKRWLSESVHGYNAKGLVMIALADAAIITGVIRFPDWITSTLEWFFSDDLPNASERTSK